jgi:uncharacterized protein (TIGR01777 family)
VRVLVTGGTGFIGGPLCRALEAAGHAVTVVSREPRRIPGRAVGWDEVGPAVGESDAIVNLAGEPIAARRWTEAQKTRIRRSRVDATRTLIDAITSASRRPELLLSASAIGWYGSRGDEPVDETASPGDDFLAGVCRAWEEEAVRAEPLGLRVVRLRLGVVLAGDGGALARMLPPFRAFVGGPIGSGRQWMSWIHRDDVKGLVLTALADDRWRGPVNATAPAPVRNAEFSRTLGEVLGRPSWLPVPAAVLRLALGEMAEMLLDGQRVLPTAADRCHYAWRHPALAGALAASVGR